MPRSKCDEDSRQPRDALPIANAKDAMRIGWFSAQRSAEKQETERRTLVEAPLWPLFRDRHRQCEGRMR